MTIIWYRSSNGDVKGEWRACLSEPA